jgi:hypothetical protein
MRIPRRARGRTINALAAASLIGTAAALTAGGVHAAQAPIVSTGDPYAACVGVGADNPAIFNPPGVNYYSGEVEPWVADNPANPLNLVGSWQQDRWSDGGAKGLVAAWSNDGGGHWGETPLPFSQCAARYYNGVVLPYDRASDPWDSIGPDRTVYAVSLSFNANDNNNAIGAAVSLSQGANWVRQQAIITDSTNDPTEPFNDKESVTADPTTAGVAYVVWDRLVDAPCNGFAARRRPASDNHALVHRSAQVQSDQALDCFAGPTYFSRTTDGGRSWSTPRPLMSNFINQQTIANQIVVNRQTGTLYDFFCYIDYRTDENGEATVEMMRSTDKGLTWSPPQMVGDLESVGVHDPKNPDNFLRTGDIIPEPAIDPNTGQLYVVWQDARYNGDQNDQVVISTSTGGGLTGTWSPPTLVNPPGDPAAFTPAISVNSRGQVGVQYYDLRAPEPPASAHILPTDTWLNTTSGPGVTFTHETQLSGPFNMLAAPYEYGEGYFIGDYEGLATDWNGTLFHPFFVQTECADNSCDAVGTPNGSPQGPDSTDVFAERISP